LEQEKSPSKVLDVIIGAVALLMVVYHLSITQHIFTSAIENLVIHLGFALVLVYLLSMKKAKSKKAWFLPLLLIAASLTVTVYIIAFFSHLEEVPGMPNPTDFVMGIILIVVVVEATRRAWGLTLPLIAIIFAAYFFFGQHLPWGLTHPPFLPKFIVSVLGIGFSGVLGDFTAVSANFIFLFMVFGGLLQISGALELILEIGKAAGKVLAGGPAQTAVIGSSMVGMVSGSAVANVVLTGSFTIPLMKNSGYRPEVAGAVEACASTGGQLMPPIMGAAAFIMALLLGVPYVTVMVAALIPVILYYYSVGLGVEIIARKDRIPPSKEPVNGKLILSRAPSFLVPLGLIIVLLLMRYSPNYTAFYGIIALLVLTFIRRSTRPSFSKLIQGFSEGAASGAQIAVACGTVGIIAQTLYTTGLGVKFTGIVEQLFAGNLFPALLATMIISIILGCGVPTLGAYVIVALVVSPALVRMGVPQLSAHFFAFYFAIISALTPPVAMAILAASAIAKGSYWKMGLESVKLAIGGFIIPFLIIYSPVILLHGGEPLDGVLSILASFLSITSLSALVHSYFLVRTGWLQRIAFATCAGVSLAYIVTQNYILMAVSIPLFIGLMVIQWNERKRLKTIEA